MEIQFQVVTRSIRSYPLELLGKARFFQFWRIQRNKVNKLLYDFRKEWRKYSLKIRSFNQSIKLVEPPTELELESSQWSGGVWGLRIVKDELIHDFGQGSEWRSKIKWKEIVEIVRRIEYVEWFWWLSIWKA